jgi:integrase
LDFGSGVAIAVVRHTHAVLHNALEQAVAWKKITSNPCALPAVVLPKVKTEELTVLSQDDAAMFLQVAGTMSYGFLFEFALLTGMRPEEYLALQWPDIDFERATAMVQRVLIRHKKSWTFEEPKTKGSRRPVSLPATLVHKLSAHKRAQAEQRLRVGASWQDHKLAFCGKSGAPLTIPNITYRYFRPLLEKAKLPHMRLYDLRHSHATLLLIAGEHPKVVSERLGHASIRITMDTYSHVLPNMQERTATQLENTFYGANDSARTISAHGRRS